MFRKKISLFVFLSFFVFSKACFSVPSWQKPMQPPSSGSLKYLISNPFDKTKFMLASNNQIFESSSSFKWQLLFSEPGISTNIRSLHAFPFLPNLLFILSEKKLLKIDLKSGKCTPLYKITGEENSCLLSFTADPKNPSHYFLGTDSALLETKTGGENWNESKLFSGKGAVSLLFFSESFLFLGVKNILYGINSDKQTKLLINIPYSVIERDLSLDEESFDSNEISVFLKDIIISPNNPLFLWIATTRGVFESKDGGNAWHAMSRSGLKSSIINSLSFSKSSNSLFAATFDGVYSYSSKSKAWRNIFAGLAKNKTFSLSVLSNESESLLAITEDGFMSYPLLPDFVQSETSYEPPFKKISMLRSLFILEPTALDVQKSVIKYANVKNSKIKRWHWGSRLSALVPSFSFGKNFSASNNIDLDRMSSSVPDVYINGPDDINRSWDMDVDWDFGDFLYSSAHTSIDSREKSMVDLRNDLLSEAMRIYYERRRLQIEIVFSLPSSKQEHLEKLLRMDELTSLLDAMTDGFFSVRLTQIYKRNLELSQLWDFSGIPRMGEFSFL